MTPQYGLYYPYVHFRDDAWLKAMALYWPKIARIVPQGFPVRDSQVTQALRSELNFIVDVSPQSAILDASKVMQDALVLCGDRLLARHGLAPDFWHAALNDPMRYDWRIFDRDNYLPRTPTDTRLVGLESNQITPGLLQTSEYAATVARGFTDEPNDSAFKHKAWRRLREMRMSRELTVELTHRRLAAPIGGKWTAISPDVAWVYMCVLAERLASHNGFSPITDQDSAYLASQDWTAERVASVLLGKQIDHRRDPDDLPHTVGILALQLVVPKNLHEIPVTKIAALRRQYAYEFDAFNEATVAVANSMSACQFSKMDDTVLSAYVADAVDRYFKRPLHAIKNALKGARIDTTLAAGQMKFEVPAAAAAGALATGEPVVGVTAGAALAIVNMARSHFVQRRQALTPSAASYLWQLERALKPQALLRRSLQRGRRLND